MYSLPQEIEVWYIIPAIRRELAKILKKKGLKQKETAKILGTTEAAVSQYLHKKRACGIKFPDKMKKEIEKSADKIIKDNKIIVREIMALINKIKKQGIACQACKKYNKGILKLCSAKPIMELK